MGGINPIVQTDATDFPGLHTLADPRDILAGGAQEQINMMCKSGGMMECRGGVRPGTFANGIAPVSGAVYSMIHFNAPNEEWLVFQQADGTIRAGNGFL